MTFDNEIEKVKAEIKVLQSKLEFLGEIEKHKYQEVKNAYKDVYGYYPDVLSLSWIGFQRGWNAAMQNQNNIEEVLDNSTTLPESNDWKTVALNFGELLSSVGPNGYYNMTADQWLEWAKNTYTSNEVIKCDEKDNPPEPTRNKYFERILNAPIDERGYIDLREPASEFRQKLFDGIKSVFYDPEYERTHWSVKVNMAVDEVFTHFYEVIPDKEYHSKQTYDMGWNDCIDAIKGRMEMEE
jgi:hypothetical protein